MIVNRLCVPAVLIVILSLTGFPALAQQAAPQAGQATEEEEAGTRGLQGSRTKTQPSKRTTPAKGEPAKSGDTGASKGKPATGPNTLVGAPATDPSSSRTKPPDAGQAGTDTKTIMPVPPPSKLVSTPPSGQIITPPPPTTAYPPGGSPATGGAPAPRPAPQSQQAAGDNVVCVNGANGPECLVDNDNNGQPDPNSAAFAVPPGATAVQVGDYVYVDLDGDGNVDAVFRGRIAEDVAVAGAIRPVDVITLPYRPSDAGVYLPPGSSVDLNGDGVVDVVTGADTSDQTGDGIPDIIYNPKNPGGNPIKVGDLTGGGPPIKPPQPPAQPPQPPSAGGAVGGSSTPLFALVFGARPAPVCEEPGLEVLPRLDCLQQAFRVGRFGEPDYEARKMKALTLIDAPHMGAEQALRTLNDALRLSLISQNNYYTKVNQVISRL